MTDDIIIIDGLSYSPKSGDFIWIEPRCPNVKKGTVAGSFDAYGYRKVKWRGKSVFAHRLAWLFVFGHWPQKQIDHINGVKDDNRISNLREATHSQNCANRVGWRDGLKGASFHKKSGKWAAGIRIDGCRKHLGLFETEAQAHLAYARAAKIYHKQFSCSSTPGEGYELEWAR